MKKVVLNLFPGLVLIIVVIVFWWISLKPELIGDNIYLVGSNSLYKIDISRLVLKKIYSNSSEKMIEGKVLKVDNQYSVFMTNVVEGEKNFITAWVSKTDNRNVNLVEINPRLGRTKVYSIRLDVGPKIQLLDPVGDMRPARGGVDPFGGTFKGDNYIWVIPKMEPTGKSNEYYYKGIQVRYTDTIPYPVVVRSAGRVEYRYKAETLFNEQPAFDPGE